MNRSHNSKEGIDCIKNAKKVGFNNITVDLIYGIPNQTLGEWEENLDILFSLDIVSGIIIDSKKEVCF